MKNTPDFLETYWKVPDKNELVYIDTSEEVVIYEPNCNSFPVMKSREEIEAMTLEEVKEFISDKIIERLIK